MCFEEAKRRGKEGEMFIRKLYKAIVLIVTFGTGVLGIANSVFASYFGYDTWFDAEKTLAYDDDDYMCWAAAASNILAWGGWGTSEFNNEDKIFQNFQDHWTNEGGMMEYGWDWWLNGTEPPDEPGWSQVDVPGGGNYWPEYNFSDYYYENWETAQAMSAIDEYLHAGYGVTLAIYQGQSGHALTVWGYEYSDSSGYEGIYVTDSDDYQDTLAYYAISPAGSKWQLGGGYSGWYIGGVEALAVVPEPVSSVLFLFGGATLAVRSCWKRRKRP